MYYIYGQYGPSLPIESIDYMIIVPDSLMMIKESKQLHSVVLRLIDVLFKYYVWNYMYLVCSYSVLNVLTLAEGQPAGTYRSV